MDFVVIAIALILSIYVFGIISVLQTGVFCLALLFCFYIIFKSDTGALILIFTMAFTQGVLELIGIPMIVPKSIAELTVILLLLKAIYFQGIVKKRSIKVFGLLPMFGLFYIILLSFYINEQPTLRFLLFSRHMFIFYLLFIALLNLNLSEEAVKRINKYAIFLFLIQIPAAIVKLIVIGQDEGRGIGTVSMQGGQLSTTLPLFAIAFSLAFYLFSRNKLLIGVIAGFIAFSLINEKRAFIFYLPVLMFFILYVYGKGNLHGKTSIFNRSRIKIISLIILITIGGLFVAAKTVRTLNPETGWGGSFNIGFMLDSVVKYETAITAEGYSFGRLASTIHSYNILKKEGLLTLLLGFGPGFLAQSSLVDQQEYDVYMNIGIRAGKTGVVWLINQIGLLGVLFFLLFYMRLFKKANVIYREISDPYWKPIALGFVGASFVFILDILTYSYGTFTFGVLTPIYYYIAAICLKIKTFQGISLNSEKRVSV